VAKIAVKPAVTPGLSCPETFNKIISLSIVAIIIDLILRWAKIDNLLVIKKDIGGFFGKSVWGFDYCIDSKNTSL
jgi:hypothetical protein